MAFAADTIDEKIRLLSMASVSPSAECLFTRKWWISNRNRKKCRRVSLKFDQKDRNSSGNFDLFPILW